APGAEGGRLPVVLHEADVVLLRIDAQRVERAQVLLLHVERGGLEHYLVLVEVLEPVGVVAVAAVGWPPAGRQSGDVPWPGPQRTQEGRGVERSRTHLGVLRRRHQAAPV